MIRMIEGLCEDWRHFDGRIDALTSEIDVLVKNDEACQRLITIPGVLTERIIQMAVDERIAPYLEAVLPLSAVPEALQRTGQGEVLGKIVVRP